MLIEYENLAALFMYISKIIKYVDKSVAHIIKMYFNIRYEDL